MFHTLICDIGAFVYWICIKFGRTDYEEEASEKNYGRNFLVFLVATFLIAFVVLRIL